MDLETALTIIEGCAIGSLSPDSRSCDAMAVVNREIERLQSALLRCNVLALGYYDSLPGDRCQAIAAHVREVFGKATQSGGNDASNSN